MTILNRRKWVYYLLLIGSMAVLYLNARAFPELAVCWFYGSTGWQCPGCGTQRALEAIFLNADFKAAIQYNAMVVLALLAGLVWLILFLLPIDEPRRRLGKLLGYHWTPWIVGLTVLAYTILRNL